MASTDPKAEQDKPLEQKTEQKPATLGEDDEFEDFPVDGTIPLAHNVAHLGLPNKLPYTCPQSKSKQYRSGS